MLPGGVVTVVGVLLPPTVVGCEHHRIVSVGLFSAYENVHIKHVNNILRSECLCN